MSEESNAGDSTAEAPAEQTTEEAGTPGAEGEAPATTPSEIARMYKVKIDGEDQEVDEAELIRGYQLRKASDKRFSEGQQARKQSEEFIRLLKTDPKKVLSHPSIGLDVKKFAEEYLMSELQQEMLTPEQKELKEYKSKLEEYEQQAKAAKEKEAADAQAAVRKKYAEDYNRQITEALETSGLPKTEHTVQRMIHYMHQALKNGYELGAADVTDLVRQDYINDTKSLYSSMDADALMKIIGPDMAKKIRKHDLNKIKNPKNHLDAPTDVTRSEKGGEAAKSKKMTPDEWKAEVMRRANS